MTSTDEKLSMLSDFHSDNKPPFSVDELAKKYGLEIFRGKFIKSVSGWIEKTENNSFKIVVNKDHPTQRRRFTAAHEIAHYILHEELIGERISDNALYRSTLSNRQEVEANKLAAEILMPKHSLLDNLLNKKKAGQLKGLTDKDLLSLIGTLAKEYNVSKEAMTIRLGAEFGLWPS